MNKRGIQGLSKVGGVVAGIVGLVLGYSVQAGVPLNNLQGAGGVAFNPLAYPSGQNKDPQHKGGEPFSKPQFGGWYVNLGDVNVDWTAVGVSETLFDRFEVSYGYEVIAPKGENIKKSNVGAKLNLIRENQGGITSCRRCRSGPSGKPRITWPPDPMTVAMISMVWPRN